MQTSKGFYYTRQSFKPDLFAGVNQTAHILHALINILFSGQRPKFQAHEG